MDAFNIEPGLVETNPTEILYFENLEAHHCRYPYGDELPFTFCGKQRRKGSSYCLVHSLRCEVIR